MPIFCSDVNQTNQEKLVPITRHNGASLVPDTPVMTLELVLVSPENGPFWELEAEQSQQATSEGAPSVKRDTSDVNEWGPGGLFVIHSAYGSVGNLTGHSKCSDDGTIQTSFHERSEDGVNWSPSMEVASTKVEESTQPILTIWASIHHASNPASLARKMAWVRSATCSLLMILDT